ncbi:MAG: septum formation initiator family protein [Deltaproteobacteria bacterium]|nr:septum formation initiator family protein [Deltaproteobacteria bacterium]
MAGAIAAEGTQKGGKNRRLLLGVGVFVGLALTFLVLFSHKGLYRIYCLRQERQAVEQETARLAAENARLARTIDRLQHDPEMIQDLIRRELNFIRKNEIIFQFPPESGNKSPVSPALSQTKPGRSPSGAGGKDDRTRSLSGAPPGAPGAGTLRRGHAPAGRNLLSAGPVPPGSGGEPAGSLFIP